MFGSAKGSNEEAYLFQKLVRTGFVLQQLSTIARGCWPRLPRSAALMEGLNSGAVVWAPFAAALDAKSHYRDRRQPGDQPPGWPRPFLKNAAKSGAKLIVMDPRGQALSRHAYKHLAFKAGSSDVAMPECDDQHHHHRRAFTDDQYIAGYTEGFDELKERIREFTPEKIGADLRHRGRNLARGWRRLYARSRALPIIFWGNGASASMCKRTDNAALPDRAGC